MTAPISAIDMYNILRAKIGEQEAKTLTDFVESEVERRLEAKSVILATKDDIAAVRKEISDSKVDTIKWMVGLFITLALMIIGLYIKK
jgi:hypothetical protein